MPVGLISVLNLFDINRKDFLMRKKLFISLITKSQVPGYVNQVLKFKFRIKMIEQEYFLISCEACCQGIKLFWKHSCC